MHKLIYLKNGRILQNATYANGQSFTGKMSILR
jgi:hypothetical protein